MDKKEILDNYFNEYIELSPVLYTFYGFRGKEDIFKNIDDKEIIQYYIKKFIDTNDKLRTLQRQGDEHNYNIYRLIIEHTRMNIYYYSLPFIYIPFNHKRNPITTFITMNTDDKTFLETIDDYKNYFKRIISFKKYMIYQTNRSIDGLKKGFSPPKRTVEFMIKQIDNILLNESLKKDVPESLEGEYNKLYSDIIIPTVIYFREFLQKYLKYCRNTIGIHLVCKYSNIGIKMYKYLIQKHITIDISPKDIHKLGLEEVSKITNNMSRIKDKMGFSIITNNEFYKTKIFKTFNNSDELLSHFKKLQNDNILVIKKYFYKDIQKRANIRLIPSHKKLEHIAFYVAPSVEPLREGAFYINSNTDLLPICICKSLSLHEDSPGHHFQFQYMKEANLSNFLIYNKNTAYVEGWALYVESLGDYNDIELFGKYMEEKLRAIRLVIDTGIHYYGWSYEKALEYFSQNSLLPIDKIKKELERYIAMPAQALGYKLGELFFSRKQKEWLAKGLDIKEYHRIILEGGILSMTDLERNIDSVLNK